MNNSDWFEAGYIESDILWFVSVKYNILCEYDLITQEEKNILFFPEKVRCGGRVFSEIKKYKDTLVFIPIKAEYLVLYNLVGKNFELISLKEVTHNFEKGTFGCYVSYIFDNALYMFSWNYEKIVKYDFICGELLDENIHHYTFGGEKKQLRLVFTSKISCYDNKVLGALADSNQLLWIDFCAKQVEVITVGKEEERFTTPIYDGDSFWMMAYGNDKNIIVKYDVCEHETTYFNVNEQLFIEEKCLNYIKAKEVEDWIYFYPSNCGGNIVGIHKKNYDIKKIRLSNKDAEKYAFSFCFEGVKRTFLGDKFTNTIYIYDGKWTKKELIFHKKYMKATHISDYCGMDVVLESEKLFLDEYIYYITRKNNQNCWERKEKGVGDMVWNRFVENP